MTELPRSRALVRLDGPGHIMPVEPVTPADSRAWRVIHFPVMLGIVAFGLLLLAVLAIQLLNLGFQSFSYVPGARYLAPLIGAAAVVAVYVVFARFVERRPAIEELGAAGQLSELALGFAGGIALSLAAFAILLALGAVRVTGVNPPQVMLLVFVVQMCTAIALEILLRGLAFRLVERLLGSWLTLLAIVIAIGAAALAATAAAPSVVLALLLETGLTGAALFMVTRRLWAAIGVHAAWNIAQIGLYGGAESAGAPRGVVRSHLVGPDWLTGGGMGADASAPALLVHALLVVTLLAIAVRRGRIVRPIWRRGRTA